MAKQRFETSELSPVARGEILKMLMELAIHFFSRWGPCMFQSVNKCKLSAVFGLHPRRQLCRALQGKLWSLFSPFSASFLHGRRYVPELGNLNYLLFFSRPTRQSTPFCTPGMSAVDPAVVLSCSMAQLGLGWAQYHIGPVVSDLLTGLAMTWTYAFSLGHWNV